jgi:hypothetical protein
MLSESDQRFAEECGRNIRQTRFYPCAKCGREFSMWGGSPTLGLCDPCMGTLDIH